MLEYWNNGMMLDAGYWMLEYLKWNIGVIPMTK